MITINQIGCGGTGAWAARALAHGLVNMDWGDDPPPITWNLIDNDFIELKNQLRQPFLGKEAVGEYKADYNLKVVSNIITAGEEYTNKELPITINCYRNLIESIEQFDELSYIKDLAEGVDRGNTLFSNNTHDLVIFLMAVDNTLTRRLMEEFFDKHREILHDNWNNHSSYTPDLWYIDAGNNDKVWQLMCLPAKAVPVIDYHSITLPDALISCADREETDSVPQTTHQNMICGGYAARSVLKIIASNFFIDPEIPPFIGEYYSSKDDEVTRYHTLPYLKAVIKDLSIPDEEGVKHGLDVKYIK